jgi:tyrosine-specific transport protein
MYYAGLVHLEINLFYGRQAASIGRLAHRSLGVGPGLLASGATAILFYALLAAYGVGGASLLQGILRQLMGVDLSHAGLTVGFILVLAGLTASQMKWVDYTNRLLFMAKIGVFALLMGRLIPAIEPSLWKASEGTFNLTAVAIFCTSFGFHISIPRLLPYLNYDVKSLKQAFFWGTVGALGFYLLWTLAAIGIIPGQGENSFATVARSHNDLGAFLEVLNHRTGVTSLSLMTNVFSLLAILTSFLGVGAGLLAFLQEGVEKIIPRSSPGVQGVLGAFLTYSVPLGFALFYPQGFIKALEYAGISATLLSVTLPTAIGLKQRFQDPQSSPRAFSTPGGGVGMGLALLLSLGMIIMEFIK